MRVKVIGSGLGGLLTACRLAKAGYDVEVFERLPYAGGRFTNLEFKGYQLSTGALHMIPHSSRGPLGRMLRELGASVEIIDSEPQALFRINGRDYTHREIIKAFPLKEKAGILKLLAALKLTRGSEESFASFVRRHTKSDLAQKIARAYTGWSLSLEPEEVSSREVLAEVKNIYRLRGPGIPVGGCKAVIDALLEVLLSEGGRIRLKSRVDAIYGRDKAEGIVVKGEKLKADVIVSNIGLKATAELAPELFPPEYRDEVGKIKPAWGIKISVACSKPMLGFSGVLFTPEAKAVHGVNEVTNASPDLAPPGKHLLMSHQGLNYKEDVRKAIETGIKDLHTIFPDFKKHCEILAVQVYRRDMPVNRTASGIEVSPETPVENIFNVGDAVKPLGFMETDGIAAGVERAVESIERLN